MVHFNTGNEFKVLKGLYRGSLTDYRYLVWHLFGSCIICLLVSWEGFCGRYACRYNYVDLHRLHMQQIFNFILNCWSFAYLSRNDLPQLSPNGIAKPIVMQFFSPSWLFKYLDYYSELFCRLYSPRRRSSLYFLLHRVVRICNKGLSYWYA